MNVFGNLRYDPDVFDHFLEEAIIFVLNES